MPDPTENQRGELSPVEIRCYFVRERNALLVRGDFGPLYMDYYLHWMQHGIQLAPEHDAILKEAVAAMALHQASRPHDEIHAWTINFQHPLLNVFVTGDNTLATVTGRIWNDGVKPMENGLFCAEKTTRYSTSTQRSTVQLRRGDTPFPATEEFYQQSEQRCARIFRHSPEDFVMISSQPDCDLEWLTGLTEKDIREIDKTEDLSLLETRRYYFDCGCSAEKIIPRFAGLSLEDRDEIFGGDPSIRISCPRCGAKIDITRKEFDDLLN